MKLTQLPPLSETVHDKVKSMPAEWGDGTDRFLAEAFPTLTSRKDRMALWFLVSHPDSPELDSIKAIAALDPNMDKFPWLRNIGRAKVALGISPVRKKEESKEPTPRPGPEPALKDLLSQCRLIMEDCKIDTISLPHLIEELEDRGYGGYTIRTLPTKLRELGLKMRRPRVDTDTGRRQVNGFYLRDVVASLPPSGKKRPVSTSKKPTPSARPLKIDGKIDQHAEEALEQELKRIDQAIKTLEIKRSAVRDLAESLYPAKFL